jgi:ADP-ribose pyrophosphatase YjhB (NUDIX family)
MTRRRSRAVELSSVLRLLAREYRTTLLGAVFAILGIVGFITDLWLGVVIVLAVASVILSVLEIRDRMTAWGSLRFQPKRQFTRASDLHLDADDHFVSTGRETGVALGTASERLRSEAVPVEVVPPYRLPDVFARWTVPFLANQVSQSRLWNGPALALSDDIEPAGPARLSVCSYFDFVQTNILATHDIYESGRLGSTPSKSGRDWLVDRNGRLRTISESWLANLIGVSTLAFTSDGKLVLVRQTRKNKGSPGDWAPSGSGALEPQDLGAGSATLQEVLLDGANRELVEETGVRGPEVEASSVLGHGRWLTRGAMPEFTGATLLSVSSAELDQRPLPSSERVFTERRECIRLPPSSTWSAEDPLSVLPVHVQEACSFPLALAMTLLVTIREADRSDVVVEAVRRSDS